MHEIAFLEHKEVQKWVAAVARHRLPAICVNVRISLQASVDRTMEILQMAAKGPALANESSPEAPGLAGPDADLEGSE